MRRPFLFVCCVFLLAIPAVAQRLPRTVIPEHYTLQLVPDLGRGTFAGEETIDVAVCEPVSVIELHSFGLEIGDATVTSAGQAQQVTVTPDPKTQIVQLKLAQALAGGEAAIHVRFSGKLNDELHGFYQSHSARRKYAVTFFEPVFARNAFPCFDEPDLKATFDLSTIVDDGDTAISNGKIVSDRPGPSAGKHTIHFATSPKMSTYLVALAVGDFQCAEDSVNGTPIRVCAPPEDEARTQFALQVMKRSLPFYEQYFGIKYPFGKLDMVIGPDFIPGMENTASIFCNDEMLLDEKDSPLSTQQEVADTISHEVAHQWFGDLVTLKWWDDTWLNEGFATWISPKVLQQWRPDWTLSEGLLNEGIYLDSLRSTHPVRTDLEDPTKLFSAFDDITYGKTAAVLRMLESYLGKELFRAGISAYLKKYAFGNATAEDLWKTLAEVSHRPIIPLMRSFIDQPGIPLVTVESTCEDGNTRLKLSQHRYFFDHALATKAASERWQIPVCYRRPSGTQCILLTEQAQTFKINGCENWLTGNSAGEGYYRTLYSPATLAPLLANARSLDAGEQSALLRDSWALAQSGQAPITDFLKVMQAVDLTSNANIGSRVARNIDQLDDRLATEASTPAFQKRVRQLLRPVAAKLGWYPAVGENDERRKLRSTILYALGTTGGDPEVVAEARRRTDRYLDDPTSIDATMAESILTIAAWNGDAELFDRIAAKAKSAKTHDELFRYLHALGTFRDPALMQRALAIMQSNVQPGELSYIMPDMLGHAATRATTWEYEKAHWKEIDEHQLYFGRAYFIETLGNFCDATHRRDVESFFATNDPKDAANSLHGALEQIDYCIAFRETQRPAFEEWLK
jgi:aminopeptidase N